MSGPNNYSSWSDDEIVTLKKLYAKGLTNGQIAAQIRGRSRNAVIGKVARLIAARKLAYRGSNTIAAANAISAAGRRMQARIRSGVQDMSPAQRAARAAAKPPNNHDDTPRPPKAPPPPKEAPGPSARPWLTRLEGECRAPIGEPNADMLMCCARAGHGYNGDYCERHARRFYTPTKRQDDERTARRFA